MKTLLFILICFICGNVFAEDDRPIFGHDKWTTSDTVYESTFAVAELSDMFTTLDIKNHADIEESNPFLGKHPSDIKVVSLCLGVLVAHYGIATLLSDDARRIWQVSATIIELGYVNNNVSLGLHFTF